VDAIRAWKIVEGTWAGFYCGLKGRGKQIYAAIEVKRVPILSLLIKNEKLSD